MKTTFHLIIVAQLFTLLFTSEKLFAQHPATAFLFSKNLPQELLKQKQIEFPSQQIRQGGLRDIFLETGFRANQWKENSQTWGGV